MKKTFYYFILICLCQSCSKVLVLTNRTFIDDDPYKINSLQFINDSICVYEQKFLCDLDDQYKETKIICHYETVKNRIILNNTTKHADSINTPCFKLPEDEIRKCYFLNQELLEQKPLVLGRSGLTTKINLYGYISNIVTDTLSYKRHTIYYNEWNRCSEYSMFKTILFNEEKQ